MKIIIKNRYTSEIKIEGDFESLREAVVKNCADLGGADLRGADLRGAYLGGADLGDANLRSADLRGADLGGAYLGGANLRSAKITISQKDELIKSLKVEIVMDKED